MKAPKPFSVGMAVVDKNSYPQAMHQGYPLRRGFQGESPFHAGNERNETPFDTFLTGR